VLYLLGLFWPWLALAAACAAIVGWRAPVPAGWLPICALAVAAGLVAAQMQWLAGRAGMWLETGVMFFVAYIFGCCLGALMRRAARRTA
jgi:hypothetical protein